MLAGAMGFAFEVDSFARVDASADTALLRISGRWRSDEPTDLGVPVLLVDDGRRSHPVQPLPDPSGGTASASPAGDPWRAAFPVPTALLTARTAYALRAGPAGIVEIPAPGPTRPVTGSGTVERPPARPAVTPEREPAEAREAAAAHRALLADLETQLSEEAEAREAA